MSNVPLSFLPGVCKSNSAYADSIQQSYVSGRQAVGRITDMDGVRFVAGYPEKIGGNELAYTTALTGVPRGMRDWRDNQQVIYVGVGTNSKLYECSRGVETDITPLLALSTSSLSNAITTINGQSVVTIAHAAHGQQSDDYVVLTAASAVGGITVAGTYHITVIDADSYTIDTGQIATSGATGGGALNYTYFRKTLTNPFGTVNGSSVVTVTDAAHGEAPGDFVHFSGATAVGGVTVDGEYVILTTSTNSYTIDAGVNATSTATGGGSVSVQYEIHAGGIDSVLAFGYGVGTYGTDGYGAGTSSVLLSARTWCLQHYGQQLLANPYGGTIYVWDPVIKGRAYPLYGAPSTMFGMFVTPERFVIALAVNGTAMKIAWPDQENYNDWTSTVENTANEGRTLQEGSFLVNGIAVRDGVSLIMSNTAVYNHTYTGDNNVYATTLAADKAGLVGPRAVAVMGGVAYWLGFAEFWQWDGSVQAMPSDDIRDYVFRDINKTQAAKFVVGSNVAKKSVWFFYCSANSTEIDRYVIYHVDQSCWSCGQVVNYTSWIDEGLLNVPMATDVNGFIYNLETGTDNHGQPLQSYIVLSPMDVSKGEQSMDIFAFIPDFKRVSGNVNLTLLTQDYMMDPMQEDGPYIMPASLSIQDVRVSGKRIGFKMESNEVGGDWRLGLPIVEAQPAGARR
jgi:hypothetical protein